jgi:hypothetical protein
MRYLFFLWVCLTLTVACSKKNDGTNSNNNVAPLPPVTIRIDTIIKYTTLNYPWIGSAKTFDFPELEGVNEPVINVYYKTPYQTSWKILPDGYTAWYRRNGRSITVFVTLTNVEISVRIIAAW